MSYGPTGMNSLFYNKGGRIKSGMPCTTWSGGMPGSTSSTSSGTSSRSAQIANCFSNAQTGAFISAVGAANNPTVAKARYKSSLDQLQKPCLKM